MDDFRRFPKGTTRQLIDYNRFLSLTNSKVFLCIDRGILEVCRYLLNSRGTWRTTYYTGVSASGYTIPTATQFETLTNAIAEANKDMASCDEIVASLDNIALQIANLGSDGGCCVVGGDTPLDEYNDSTAESFPGSSDTPPPGFSTIEEYLDYKCNAAKWIFDQYVGTLRNWAGLAGTIGGLTIAVIVGLVLLTVPPVGLTIILSAMATLTAINFGLLGGLSDIADEMETDEASILCDLYNAGSTEAAAQVLRNAAAAAITSLSLSPEATWLAITDNLASNEGCKVLLERDETIVGYGGDCSECGPGQIIQIIPFNGASATATSGEFLVGQTTVVVSVESANLFGFTRENVALDGGGFTRVLEVIDIDTESGLTTIRVNMPGDTDNDYSPASLIGEIFENTAFHFINITGGSSDSLQSFTLTLVATNP